MIRVVIAEDQDLVLGALGALLEMDSGITVVGQSANGTEAMGLIETLKPDVVVTDIEMPGMTGLDIALRIQAEKLTSRVLIVTTFGRPGYLQRAMRAGVLGYLLKDTPAEELSSAVRRVAQGERVVSSDLAAQAWGVEDPLTEREREALRLAETGQSSKEIARNLNISPGTVRNYLHEAMQKLGVNNRIEAARIARHHGWL
ncbi:MAG: response regulator transcription factor [Pseudomonadota bacterium]